MRAAHRPLHCRAAATAMLPSAVRALSISTASSSWHNKHDDSGTQRGWLRCFTMADQRASDSADRHSAERQHETCMFSMSVMAYRRMIVMLVFGSVASF